MDAEKQRLIARLKRDIGGYIEYLRENNVTEILSLPRKRNASSPLPAGGVPRNAPQKCLEDIAAEIASCKKCPLHRTRNRTVPGQGNAASPDVLFIGEGPGEDEDRQGLAFVGRAGQLLTRLIVRMGYRRGEIFIANIVKCRPPGNRKPLPEEMSACRPYLEAQVLCLRPKVIVLLGASALEGLISTETKISRIRGQWLEYQPVAGGVAAGTPIPVMPTFHPSYLLRNQSAMWDVWEDMQKVLKRLGRPVPEKK